MFINSDTNLNSTASPTLRQQFTGTFRASEARGEGDLELYLNDAGVLTGHFVVEEKKFELKGCVSSTGNALVKHTKAMNYLLLMLVLSLLLVACGIEQQQLPATEATMGTANLVLPGHDKAMDVTYEIKNGEAIFEGDIILGKVDAQGNLIKSDLASQGIVTDSGRWPGGIIPFVVNSNVTEKANVMSAIAHWEAKTPLDFVERTSQGDYIEFVTGSDSGACSSPVGRAGANNKLS
jgi:Astacin (Peptidase family M12A)